MNERENILPRFSTKNRESDPSVEMNGHSRRNRLTIKNKLIGSFFLIITIPILSLAWSSYETAKSKIDEKMVHGATESVRLLNEIFSEFITGKQKEVDLLSGSIDAKGIQVTSGSNYSTSPATQFQLNIYKKIHPEVEQVYVGTENGVYMKAPGELKNPSDYDPRKRPWYMEAIKNKLADVARSIKIGKEGYVYIWIKATCLSFIRPRK